MVFEGILANYLNRYFGDYVENLDPSQLQMGILAGDVVLKDLILKHSALNELDLPVEIVYGYVGKIVLKIPWLTLYNSSVVVRIERLFLLAVPKGERKYDAEEEQKKKEAKLQRIEDAKKEKDNATLLGMFAEKLLPHIIKNMMVYVNDVHIRYEDTHTCPQMPFSVGVTLHKLSAEYYPLVIDKVLKLECLAVYWNCKSKPFLETGINIRGLLTEFQNGIRTNQSIPYGFSYVLGPTNSSAKLRISPNATKDGSTFSLPKMLLDFPLENLLVRVSKDQYRDMIELLESLERRKRAAYYRKYRPYLTSYHGHYKQWWKFAYTCVMEEGVLRRRRNWSWQHIKAHRALCRVYAEAYKGKLTEGAEVPANRKAVLYWCERELDLINIVIVRQRAEAEVKRILAAKQGAQNYPSGWGTKHPNSTMTREEKAKLCRLTSNRENTAPPDDPTEIVEWSARLTLRSLQLEMNRDVSAMPQVRVGNFEVINSNYKRQPVAHAKSGSSQEQRR